MERLRAPIVLLGVAVLLLAPSLVLGTHLSHSSSTNLNWADQFAAQVRAGILYPRWMSDSFKELGSPAFYFYPPLPFWLDALVSIVTFNILPASYRLVVTSVLILWVSGLAMHAWLKAEASTQRMALMGAGLYMAAPYHLYDHYVRGAFAEFTAFAVLPLVVLALKRLSERRGEAVLLLAISYAALLMSHLPTALLASVTVLPAYALWRARRPVELLVGGTIGIGLAAIYVVPAMLLQGSISAEWLWSSFYHIDAWYFLTPGRWPDTSVMQVIISMAACYTLLSVAIGVQQRRLSFWGGLCLGSLLLISGAMPWFWLLPELAKVQFPWRLMTIVEFAAVTGFCTWRRPGLHGISLWLLVGVVFTLAWTITLIVNSTAEYVALSRHYSPLPRFDAQEYEPHGFPGAATEDQGISGLRKAVAVPLVACAPAARTCRATKEPFGDATIYVDSDVPTTVVLHHFYFPAWRLDAALPLTATDPFRLVSFVAPRGAHTYRLRRASLPEEQIAGAISGLSLVACLAWALLTRRRVAPGVMVRAV